VAEVKALHDEYARGSLFKSLRKLKEVASEVDKKKENQQ